MNRGSKKQERGVVHMIGRVMKGSRWVQQNKQSCNKHGFIKEEGPPRGFGRRPPWVQCQLLAWLRGSLPPWQRCWGFFSLWLWPSWAECCHTESCMPGAHFHVISLKQRVTEDERDKDAFSSGKLFYICPFLARPQFQRLVSFCFVLFLLFFFSFLFYYNFSCNSWGRIMKWASCWKHMLFSVFYPWLLDSQFPYIPHSLLCQYHRNLFLPFRCLKSILTKEKGRRCQESRFVKKKKKEKKIVAFDTRGNCKSMNILIIGTMNAAWLLSS